eukprot:jgi/Mesvir1/16565/Mv10106-RA.1
MEAGQECNGTQRKSRLAVVSNYYPPPTSFSPRSGRYLVKCDVGLYTLPGNRYGDLNQDYVAVDSVDFDPGFHEHTWGRSPASPTASRREDTNASGAGASPSDVSPVSPTANAAATDSSREPSSKAWVLCCLDGHGLLGERAAQASGNAIREFLVGKISQCGEQHHTPDLEELEDWMVEAFELGHQAALQLYDELPHEYVFGDSTFQLARDEATGAAAIDTNWGSPVYVSAPREGKRAMKRQVEFGATCSVALILGDILVVANVGDSSVVAGKEEVATTEGEMLSVDHNTICEQERTRIETEFQGTTGILEDGYLCITSGLGKGCQISVTRALGHKLMSRGGVITTPEVTSWAIEPHYKCLILASDGVWDVLTPGEAVRLVMDHAEQGAQKAAEELVTLACSLAESQHADVDNTCATVVLFSER